MEPAQIRMESALAYQVWPALDRIRQERADLGLAVDPRRPNGDIDRISFRIPVIQNTKSWRTTIPSLSEWISFSNARATA